ncbi:WbqC family protein [Robertkochia sediminum]|uniref:WbqC family protein n=1 Tax=Robertkochia sediminum TaxID=2785326 RepID=UPI0019326C3E|nr:WbqC family protein [Robertkochia sediminum]MBL7472166.1 WbqC family protein [Robertkochia sediminum]
MRHLLHPAFFANVAHFVAMAKGPFVFEKEDNYQKQTYRNRTYIYSANGVQMLSVPIKHSGNPQGHQKYKDVILEDNFDWKKQHWKTIQTAYRTSPFFEYYEDELIPFFEKKHHRLYDMNLESIELLAEIMQMDLEFEYTGSFEKTPSETADQRPLINAKSGVDHGFSSYTQVFGDRHGFIPNLSILDLLFNEGPNALSYLESQSL